MALPESAELHSIDKQAMSGCMEVKQTKRVSFSGRVRFRSILVAYTSQEISRFWYSSDALTKARITERELTTLISADAELLKHNASNLVALGIRSLAEKKEKHEQISIAIEAVLGEQEKQENEFFKETEGDDDALFFLDLEKIARCYSECTHEASEQACDRGLVMAEHLKEIDESTDTVAAKTASGKEHIAPASPMMKVKNQVSFVNAAA